MRIGATTRLRQCRRCRKGTTGGTGVLDPVTAGIIVGAVLFVLLALGVHIGVSLGLSGFLGIYLTIGPDAALAQLATIPFSTTNSFDLAVIPLFILMGSLDRKSVV